MERPVASVIVTCFNKAPFIQETVMSVLRQTYPHVQLVVVDDGSTDGSTARLADCLTGVDAELISLTNGGVSRARNVGASSAVDESEYLLFLDGDDILEPAAVETMVSYMETAPKAVLVYSIPILIDEVGTELGNDPDQKRWERTRFGRREVPHADPFTPLESVCSRFRALPSGSLIRRSAFNSSAGWDPNLCRPAKPFHAEDKDMAIQLALLGEVHRLPDALFRYRILPTPHRDTLYDGLWALNVKWWNLKQPRDQRREIRRAIRFDSRVTMFDAWSEWNWTIHRRGDRRFRETTTEAVLSSARWIALPLRLTAARYVRA